MNPEQVLWVVPEIALHSQLLAFMDITALEIFDTMLLFHALLVFSTDSKVMTFRIKLWYMTGVLI